MNSSVLIVAAGNSTRFKGKIPKQYVRIKNKTILNLTLKKFLDLDEISYIQVVINKKHKEIYSNTIKSLRSLKNFDKILPPCFGGSERSVSVKKGLIAISNLNEVPKKILIHDAARPFISKKIIKKTISKLDAFDAVFPGIRIVDTLWKINKKGFKYLKNRELYFRAQTPQGFNFQKIFRAHINNKNDFAYDDVYLANKNKFSIKKIEGSDLNIKITNPEDIKIAERFLR